MEKYLHGGIETHVEDQARMLRQLGVTVTIMAAQLCESTPAEVIPFVIAKDMRARDFCAELDRLTDFARQHAVTHIHCHSPFVAVLGACVASQLNIPLLLTVHGVFDATRQINATLGLLISKIGFASASKVLPISLEAAEQTSQIHGIELEQLSVVMNAVEHWQDPTAATPEKGAWVFVSRLAVRHVDALGRLIAALPDLPISRLDVFGDGSDYQRALALFGDREDVVFHGFVEGADRKISGFEGVACYGGRSFLEAVAAGKPCLVCHETGLTGLVSPDLIEASRHVNFEGDEGNVRSSGQIKTDWDQLTAADNIKACQAILATSHDSRVVWKDYYDRFLKQPLALKKNLMVSAFIEAAKNLAGQNMIFCQHDLLVALRDGLPATAKEQADITSIGFDLMHAELRVLRRQIKELKSGER